MIKKAVILVCALALPLAAQCASPLLTVLAAPDSQASDLALAMESGFIQCNPAIGLPLGLSARGVKFASPAHPILPSSPTKARMLLVPNAAGKADTEQTADHHAYLSAGGRYKLEIPVELSPELKITQVAQAAFFSMVPATEAITLTFNVDADVAIKELDRRFGGAVTTRLGERYATAGRWYVRDRNPHSLTCYRQPDVAEHGE